MVQALIKLQQEDGRWQSEWTQMRENEPAVATGFAIITLSEALRAISKD